jgi:hypothetical protein
MNCAEFQKNLPYTIETGGNKQEEEHLRTCDICSDLVQDLRYIADAAKMLVPMEDPSPEVWTGIEKTLQQEGLIRPDDGPTGPRGRLLSFKASLGLLVIFGTAAFTAFHALLGS